MKHSIDEPCSCLDCQYVDIMIGDPTLNPWEREFIRNLADWGWQAEYTPKQKAALDRLFKKQQRRWRDTGPARELTKAAK